MPGVTVLLLRSWVKFLLRTCRSPAAVPCAAGNGKQTRSSMSCEYMKLCMFRFLNGESGLMREVPVCILKSFFKELAGCGSAEAGDAFVFMSCSPWKSDLWAKLGVRLWPPEPSPTVCLRDDTYVWGLSTLSLFRLPEVSDRQESAY